MQEQRGLEEWSEAGKSLLSSRQKEQEGTGFGGLVVEEAAGLGGLRKRGS